jgi:predicted RNA-binding Zn ribbon-like protein
MVTRSEPAYVWDFCGGHLALDFTNTVGDRGGTADEHFNVYGDVVSWAEARGVIRHAEARRLGEEAARRPGAARDALAAVLALREALYRVIDAASFGRKPSSADLATINTEVGAAFSRAHLKVEAEGLSLAFEPAGRSTLAAVVLDPIIRAAVDLLTTDALARVRRCADESCAWLFLDTTRSGTRRWCDMKECGNRNKVRRFRDAKAERSRKRLMT